MVNHVSSASTATVIPVNHSNTVSNFSAIQSNVIVQHRNSSVNDIAGIVQQPLIANYANVVAAPSQQQQRFYPNNVAQINTVITPQVGQTHSNFYTNSTSIVVTFSFLKPFI